MTPHPGVGTTLFSGVIVRIACNPWQSQGTSSDTIGNTLRFTYDASGSPMLVTYNGTAYYYETNLQGDIIAIVNANGQPVVQYEYDPWGKLLCTTGSMASTLGVYNPLRYRGYIYDQDTELYYLQSRYYDPALRRFLNADGFTATGQGITGNNMFAYCGNNPVNRADCTGQFWGGLKEFVYGILADVFGSSQSTGSAQPYKEVSGSVTNCYGYVNGSSTPEYVGSASGLDHITNVSDLCDIDYITEVVREDYHAKGQTARIISGPEAKILSCEYRIALRVTTKPDVCALEKSDLVLADYHFMVQTSSGCWAEKRGLIETSICWDNGLSPDDLTWSMNGHDHEFYDSKTVYLAIGQ